MGSSSSKQILDIILNIAVPVLDQILSNIPIESLINKIKFTKDLKTLLGDPMGDYTQIYNDSLAHIINDYYNKYGYQYAGDSSTPPYATDNLIYGFEDFCYYNPNNALSSNMSQYINGQLNNGRIDAQDAGKMTNTIFGAIQHFFDNGNINWQTYTNSFQISTTSGKTAEFDFYMYYCNFVDNNNNHCAFIAYASCYYHVNPFVEKGNQLQQYLEGRIIDLLKHKQFKITI